MLLVRRAPAQVCYYAQHVLKRTLYGPIALAQSLTSVLALRGREQPHKCRKELEHVSILCAIECGESDRRRFRSTRVVPKQEQKVVQVRRNSGKPGKRLLTLTSTRADRLRSPRDIDCQRIRYWILPYHCSFSKL